MLPVWLLATPVWGWVTERITPVIGVCLNLVFGVGGCRMEVVAWILVTIAMELR